MSAVEFVEDDGGRAAAGYKGHTGDCACRALAIASGRPYQEVYELIIEEAKREKPRGKKKRSHPRTGVYRPTMHRVCERLGAYWTATMQIGSGCQVHVRGPELVWGRLVLSLSGHYSAVIDRVVRDTYDPSRGGTRCVYGFWTFPELDQ